MTYVSSVKINFQSGFHVLQTLISGICSQASCELNTPLCSARGITPQLIASVLCELFPSINLLCFTSHPHTVPFCLSIIPSILVYLQKVLQHSFRLPQQKWLHSICCQPMELHSRQWPWDPNMPMFGSIQIIRKVWCSDSQTAFRGGEAFCECY